LTGLTEMGHAKERPYDQNERESCLQRLTPPVAAAPLGANVERRNDNHAVRGPPNSAILRLGLPHHPTWSMPPAGRCERLAHHRLGVSFTKSWPEVLAKGGSCDRECGWRHDLEGDAEAQMMTGALKRGVPPVYTAPPSSTSVRQTLNAAPNR